MRTYSGGMIRRLEIARSMLHRPAVLFLDEPTVGLDPIARRAVQERLREALERLSGTRIVTNIATGGVESTRGFGLIDAWEILRTTRGGRMIQVMVTLSDWMYRSVMSESVLTLHKDYFGLRKPLERRVYEIARKHCGR